MLNGRRICTRLDLLHPCQSGIPQIALEQKEYYDVHTKPKTVSCWGVSVDQEF